MRKSDPSNTRTVSSEATGDDAPLVAELVTATIAEVRAQLDVIERRRAELGAQGFDPELGRVTAQLARAVSSLASEERARVKMAAQVRAAEMAAVKRLPRAIVISWIRELPEHDRDMLVREVVSWGERGSVLG